MLGAVEWWEVAGSLGAAVGGIGAGAGAIAAWRAANASQATSRDALEALAVGIRPRVHVGFRQRPRKAGDPLPSPTRLYLRVVNPSEWPAADLELDGLLRDGHRVREQLEHLDPGGDQMGDTGPSWEVPIRDVTPDWPGPEGDLVAASLRYSDVRRIARYEQLLEVELRASGANLAVGTGWSLPVERRIR